jgi:hypothetical protein
VSKLAPYKDILNKGTPRLQPNLLVILEENPNYCNPSKKKVLEDRVDDENNRHHQDHRDNYLLPREEVRSGLKVPTLSSKNPEASSK